MGLRWTIRVALPLVITAASALGMLLVSCNGPTAGPAGREA